MKIGILEAENLQSDILKKYGRYSDMIRDLLRSVEPRLDCQTYAVVNGEYPEDSNECDAWLITGSKAGAYDDTPWIRQLELYIQSLAEQRKKLIGICFGHQVIAQALGGRVEKSDKGWGVGVMASDVMLSKPWMQPARQQFSLLVSHQDQVTELPPGAERLAGNEFCVNSSYQLNDHILTFQGHPEFIMEYARQSMDGRRELIGEERYQRARASLANTTDHTMIANWILSFIQFKR